MGTDHEAYAPLPGDELIPHVGLSATHGIAVRSSADQVCRGPPSSARADEGSTATTSSRTWPGYDIHSADRIRVGEEVNLAPQGGARSGRTWAGASARSPRGTQGTTSRY